MTLHQAARSPHQNIGGLSLDVSWWVWFVIPLGRCGLRPNLYFRLEAVTSQLEEAMKPAIGYIRVSTARQGRSGLGLEAQQVRREPRGCARFSLSLSGYRIGRQRGR